MGDDGTVKRVLLATFADDCGAVGPSNVNNIVEGRVVFQQPETGRFFPLLEVLQDLAAAVAFIKGAIELYNVLRARLGRPPSPGELKAASKETIVTPHKLTDAKVNNVLDEVVKSINANVKAPPENLTSVARETVDNKARDESARSTTSPEIKTEGG
jgi:hypothetical protein